VDDPEARLKSLMLSGLDGDAGAHRQLLALLSVRLRAYFARRMSSDAADVEDLVQETLLAVHLRRASYDRSLAFSPWALAIARYKLIDHWRRRRLRITVPIDDVADFLSAEPPQTDDGLDLTRALGALPPRQRALIEDVKVRGLSLGEAGARAGVSEGAAKVALHRALRALAGRMRRADA
jgi:RNA polymerase sigma-70 factor (ECF subfamily)